MDRNRDRDRNRDKKRDKDRDRTGTGTGKERERERPAILRAPLLCVLINIVQSIDSQTPVSLSCLRNLTPTPFKK